MKDLKSIVLLVGLFASLSFSTLVMTSQAQEASLPYQKVDDLVWYTGDSFSLSLDIYYPKVKKRKTRFPVLLIFHGGGWLVNDESIMNDMSHYVASTQKYVVVNANYRLLGDQSNTVHLNEIVEDAFGAVLWVKENIDKYNGDSNRVCVTGDSAGGQLAAMVVNAGQNLGKSRFASKPYVFMPTYLPKGMKLKNVVKNELLKVQAAILSYGVFDVPKLIRQGFESNSYWGWAVSKQKARGIFGDSISLATHQEMYEAVSPTHTIPSRPGLMLPPQLLTVGSKDTGILPTDVKAYANKLRACGYYVEYFEHKGRPHAFLDSGSNEAMGISFEKDGVPALDRMLEFLSFVFPQAEDN